MGRLDHGGKRSDPTGDGCFQHMITGNPNDSEILIDTLFMAVLFLARAGRLFKPAGLYRGSKVSGFVPH